MHRMPATLERNEVEVGFATDRYAFLELLGGGKFGNWQMKHANFCLRNQ